MCLLMSVASTMSITIFLTDILCFWDKLANMTNHIIPIYKTYKCCLFFNLDHVSPRELLSVPVDVYQLDRVIAVNSGSSVWRAVPSRLEGITYFWRAPRGHRVLLEGIRRA